MGIHKRIKVQQDQRTKMKAHVMAQGCALRVLFGFFFVLGFIIAVGVALVIGGSFP